MGLSKRPMFFELALHNLWNRPHCCIIGSFLAALSVTAGDWRQYRGATHDGSSADRILKLWPAEGPTQMWRVPCTNGLSSLAVSGGRVFTQIRRNDGSQEREMCLALDSGTGAE